MQAGFALKSYLCRTQDSSLTAYTTGSCHLSEALCMNPQCAKRISEQNISLHTLETSKRSQQGSQYGLWSLRKERTELCSAQTVQYLPTSPYQKIPCRGPRIMGKTPLGWDA